MQGTYTNHNSNTFYTYIGDDYPVWLDTTPPLVEMTFAESARYTQSQADKLDWAELQSYRTYVGSMRFGQDSRVLAMAMFHELHCLNSLQRAFHPTSSHNEGPYHVQHCLSYLRQLFLCSADATLEPGDVMERDFTTDTTLVTRTCRDWSSLYAASETDYAAWTHANASIT
ncbi:hypothetical protein EIP91_010898 [Steccherinum ochraceum]|uniref:Oxidase ustYa n=1 Tax=Steccherinum ochraceum TaxID=92696 RepID=A0A4R0RSC7_9APHY|nr:hypothetical protein EIP91_010898 [Steccherinum ochraceum]